MSQLVFLCFIFQHRKNHVIRNNPATSSHTASDQPFLNKFQLFQIPMRSSIAAVFFIIMHFILYINKNCLNLTPIAQPRPNMSPDVRPNA